MKIDVALYENDAPKTDKLLYTIMRKKIMQIIETFGHYVENLTNTKPEIRPLAVKNGLGCAESEVSLYAG